MLTIFPLLQMTRLGYGRSIISDNIELISDGLDSDLIAKNLRETTVTCEPLYGFLPCTTKISGQLFMIVVYQYLLSQGEKYVASASTRIAKIHGTGSILGASLFNLLPTIPQLVLVICTSTYYIPSLFNFLIFFNLLKIIWSDNNCTLIFLR